LETLHPPARNPYPPGTNGSISGLIIRAQSGSCRLNSLNAKPNTGCAGASPKNCLLENQTLEWVDVRGKGWLVSCRFYVLATGSVFSSLS
jgi:hypothetical protein